MLIILRIIFGALMYWAFKEARLNASENPVSGDISNAFWVAVVVVLALANGIVWAPFFGERVGDPLAGGMVDAEYKEPSNWILKLTRWCEGRGLRGPIRWLCFVEGVRHPNRPIAFFIGMVNSREGSWLEKVFAREVFRFNNAQNCLKAYEVLKRHGIDPRPHASPGVNLVLISQEHEAKTDPGKLDVPTAPEPPKPDRNPRIQIGLD